MGCCIQDDGRILHRRLTWVGVALIALGTLLVYWPAAPIVAGLLIMRTAAACEKARQQEKALAAARAAAQQAQEAKAEAARQAASRAPGPPAVAIPRPS